MQCLARAQKTFNNCFFPSFRLPVQILLAPSPQSPFLSFFLLLLFLIILLHLWNLLNLFQHCIELPIFRLLWYLYMWSGYLYCFCRYYVCVLSRVWLFATLWTEAHQAPPSMGFSWQEYWSGLPFPPPEDLPDSGTEPMSPAFQEDSFTAESPGKLMELSKYMSPWKHTPHPPQSLALCWIIGKYSASPLEKEMATHSSTLAWKIPWMEEPGRLQPMESLRVGTTERHFSLSCSGEGNGNPLQWSCLENPRDGGAWWAAVYGVAQSQTWLRRFSSSSSKSPIIDNGESKLQPVSLKAVWHNESEALKLLT